MDHQGQKPGRRLFGILRALREPRRPLPAISKRLSTTLRSILPSKTTDKHSPLPMAKDNGPTGELPSVQRLDAPRYDDWLAARPSSWVPVDTKSEDWPLVPHPEPGDKRKRTEIEGHDERPRSSASAKAKDERTRHWVNETNGLATPDIDAPPLSPHLSPARTDSGTFNAVPEDMAVSSDYMQTWPSHAGGTHILSAAKARMSRHSHQDHFAISRRDTIDSQHRGSSVCTSQNTSTVSLAEPFVLGRRGSETTVGTSTSISGSGSERTSIKRLSTSTALTVLSTSVSSEMLPGQIIKRIRPDSRSNSFHSRTISSPRSSMHSSSAPSHKARSSLQREVAGYADSDAPPMPSLPSGSNVSLPDVPQDSADPLPAAPQSVLTAGALAKERRSRQSRSVSSDDQVGDLPRPVQSLPIDTDGLSVINENTSDAGTTKPSSSPRSSLSRSNSRCIPPGGCDAPADRPPPELETLASGAPSVFSRETSPQLSETSVTSIGDLVESNRAAEEMESDDNVSDITDHTDLSLIEAFEASQIPIPFQPILLSVLFSLRESAVARIRQRLQLMIHHPVGNHATASLLGMPSNLRSRVTAGEASGSSSGTPIEGIPSGSLPIRKKRALEDDGDGLGRPGGDDGEKRKKSNTSSAMTELQERLAKKFACPFYKHYPSSEGLSKSCRAPGWPSVHRMKEHLYRQHTAKNFTCRRCSEPFDTEAALDEHSQAIPACQPKPQALDLEVLHITETQVKKLRKRQKGVDEEARWVHVFQILFPDVPRDEIPSPYHESEIGGALSDPAVVDAFRQFAGQNLPPRIMADIDDRLRVQQMGPLPMNSMELQTIIRDAIYGVFGELLSGSTEPFPGPSQHGVSMSEPASTTAPTPHLISTPTPPPRPANPGPGAEVRRAAPEHGVTRAIGSPQLPQPSTLSFDDVPTTSHFDSMLAETFPPFPSLEPSPESSFTGTGSFQGTDFLFPFNMPNTFDGNWPLPNDQGS